MNALSTHHAPSNRAPGPGAELAGFRIESQLGRGGMGVVYLATQLRLNRQVALKVLSTELGRDHEFRERFIRESHAAAMLEDPNVLPIYDAGEADGLLYIAMRYVDGTDLGRLLDERKRLDPRHVLSLAEQIGGALDAAHQTGLVHRDVKPANILIDRRGLAYLCDFGLAQRLESAEPASDGSFLGTVDYCAPEQIAGRPTDGRTDVYALGAVCYHALTGRPPFERESETATAEAHLADPLPAASTRAPGLLPQLDGVLEIAMAKDPAGRYGTPIDFVEAFEGALGVVSGFAGDADELRVEAGAEPAPFAEAATRVLPPVSIAPQEGGRLTKDVLRTKLGTGRGPLWKKAQPWRLYTRVFQAPDPAAGRLTDDLLAARVQEERSRRRSRRRRSD